VFVDAAHSSIKLTQITVLQVEELRAIHSENLHKKLVPDVWDENKIPAVPPALTEITCSVCPALWQHGKSLLTQ
jgi:hypothetical protein